MLRPPIMKFLQTCFIQSDFHYLPFEAIWRYWVWFAQTHVELRPYWPYPLPITKVALGHHLRQCWHLESGVVKESYKRGERGERGLNDEMFKDKPRPKTYTRVKGLYLKQRKDIIFPGMDNVWYCFPWIGQIGTLGNCSDFPDPLGEIIKDLQMKKRILHRKAREYYNPNDPREYNRYCAQINQNYKKDLRETVEEYQEAHGLPKPKPKHRRLIVAPPAFIPPPIVD